MSEYTSRFAELIKVSPDSNNNRYYRMIGNGSCFEIEMGRVGANPVKMKRPMSLWEKTLSRKLAEGYIDRSDMCSIEVKGKNVYEPIPDPDVKRFIEDLQYYAKVILDESYSISWQAVSQPMLDEAQALIARISESSNDIKECRQLFMKLFAVIPRKMKEVSEMLPTDENSLHEAILREQNILDVMTAKVHQGQKESVYNSSGTVLDALGLEIRPCTDKEEAQIMRFMSKESSGLFGKAFRVKNRSTEQRFWNYLKKNGIERENISYLYHGSKNANYYGLITEGPKLNPNAPITGKMFGHGIYFANRAKKSINYTDIIGSYWNHGTSHKAYLAVYKVAYKNQLDVDQWSHEMSEFTRTKIWPYDAVFAHKGKSLINDEIIIYDEVQTTIQYIIELKSE